MSQNQKAHSNAYFNPRSQSVQHWRVEGIELLWPVEDESPYGEVFLKLDKRLGAHYSVREKRVMECSDLFLGLRRSRCGGHMLRKNAGPTSCSKGPSGHSRKKIHVQSSSNRSIRHVTTRNISLTVTRAGMFQTTGDSNLPRLGTRFALSGYIGTIRYVGKVGGTSGVWLGVEWDDSDRGKHDGIKDGKRYFACL